jgi:hypothetical protein
LNHSCQDVLDGNVLPRAGEVVGHGQDSAQVVRRVTPFGSEPAVLQNLLVWHTSECAKTRIEVQPTDLGSDVESTSDRVDLVRRAGNLGAIGNDGTRDNGAHQGAARTRVSRDQTLRAFTNHPSETRSPSARRLALKAQQDAHSPRPQPIVSSKQSLAVL